MRFGVLGPLRVWTEEGEPVPIGEAKVRTLLADLLAHPGTPVPVHRLVDALWGAELPANPASALQTKVSRLRGALGSAELVVRRSSGYLLRVETEAVDAGRFAAMAARARQNPDPRGRAALLGEALALWRGAAFEEFAEEPFALAAASRLEEERLLALEEHALARIELGEHGPLAVELAELVERHPLRERLRAVHLRALYRAGRQGEALASYQDLRERLARDLGADPGPELMALHQAILRQNPNLTAATSAATAAVDVPLRAALPAQVTPLVGREAELAAARSSLAAHRLVTFTGPGGVGKTRLAIETATLLSDDFADGVWLVELGTLDRGSSGPAVAEHVMTVLGIRDAVQGRARALDQGERLAAALAPRRMLLVLDNCEHLVADVAELVARLLRSAPELRLLTTSRERLGLPGEVLLPVEPLPVPSSLPPHPNAPLPATASTLASELPDGASQAGGGVLEAGAVRLFLARVADAVPGFVAGPVELPAVVEICRRLDGLPLALELAATRVRALGVRELAARLDDRFRLLGAGQRGVPARQRTLKAVIDWSWELLDEPGRTVLRRLSVHAGGCTLEAAEQVCGGDGIDVLDALGRLVDQSLAVVTEGPRYRLLESVAEYSAERLREAGETDLVRTRHARYYTRLVEQARLRGHDQRHWLDRLDAEAANLRRALDHASGHRALTLVTALTWYWVLRGRLDEARRALARARETAAGGEAGVPVGLVAEAGMLQTGVELLQGMGHDSVARVRAAVDAYPATTNPQVMARARWFLGFAMYGVAELEASEVLLEHALAGSEAEDDRWGRAAALFALANTALGHGDLRLAAERAERSAAIFRELGDRWGESETIFALAALAEIRGDYEEAARLLSGGLRMAEELCLWQAVVDRTVALGRLALLRGDFEGGRALHERAARVAAEQAFLPGQWFAMIGLGLGARRQGRLDEAERHLREVLDRFREWGNCGAVALVLGELGFVAELRGDAALAGKLHLEGFSAAHTFGDPRAYAFALEGLAGARALEGDGTGAALLLGAADAARRTVGAPLPAGERGDVDRIEGAALRGLGEAEFAAAFRRGARLTAEEVVRRVSG
ncbi:BTAD domain-containing putative transcriptional regulator [Nonomuraea purpurea]|uniref:BTAD domain-containing putative transcriptional regulator n=1 Tax=Nonomuraea purpurea TaxID=1849276 RepID=A0ABV8GHT6_9ACTN